MKKHYTARRLTIDAMQAGKSQYGKFTITHNNGLYTVIFDGIVYRVTVGLTYSRCIEYLECKI